jgi:hypothetical protein
MSAVEIDTLVTAVDDLKVESEKQPFRAVFIKTLTGQNHTITLDDVGATTVDELKHRIADIGCAPEDQQRLVYRGIQLESGKCLGDYGMVNCATIHLVLRLRGGGVAIVTTDMSNLESHGFCDDPLPEWRSVCSGITIEVKCRNLLCPTVEYGYRSYKMLGYGKFDMIAQEKTLVCPACDSKDVKMSTFGFTNCSYKITYESVETINGEIKVNTHSRKASVDGKNFYKFNDSDAGSATYTKLIIKTF